ncbi:FAD-dependent oxidoreductase [Microbacterium sp. zg-Y818]|uniref:FAD-dependent oxidoreductase n=1 Tax=unclassified Microbacterium TaxID=2609290 RepID=UPI00214C8C58|nr:MULTISPECIES: FAD-dependent oxidoreductase [unclassified Microbacterium]MCR2799361.1 FAD-dependent oxidoreductase [Microbacterium sp. zg.Y818]WIM21360.1 FAD-dependent oxidoreductase [Microbacterium sp. zg-Y818]
MTSHEWDDEADVVVVGSGAAGLSAAYTAGRSGLDVVVLEKSAAFGGTTAYSGAGIWLPGNHIVREAGVEDSVELGLEYLTVLVDGRTPEHLQRTYVETGPELVRFLTDTSQWLRFIHTPFPDYFPGRGRFDLGRGLFPAPVERADLGEAVDHLRATVAVDTFGILDGHPATTLVGGQALIGRFLRALADLDTVDLRRTSPVTGIIEADGEVTGVVVDSPEGARRIRARRGVILAAGGFEADADARRERHDIPGSDWTAGPVGVNTGEMITAGMDLGADSDLLDEAWWMPAVLFPNGHSAFAVGLQDGIFVGPDGKRFANELQPYDRMGHALKAYYEERGGYQRVWWILDSRHQIPPSFMQPSPDEQAFREAGLWVSADSAAELAELIGVPADALVATLERYDADAAAGVDTEFHRAEDPYDLFFVRFDRARALHPLDQPPLYAVQIVLGDLGTKGGLRIDEDARVVRADGTPIAGLYAAGNTAANVTGAIYPGPGAPIGTGMVWGYRAARHLAGVAAPA